MIIEEMTRSDCLANVACGRLGRLACARENQPYVLPFYFAYQEPYLYGFTTFGQKVEWMRANPLVCVELDQVDYYDEWTCVVIFGRYEELPDNDERREERLQAWGLLKEHACWWEPGSASRDQVSRQQVWTPIFFRIQVSEVTGRRARPDRVRPL